MAYVCSTISTKFPHNEIYLQAYKTDQTGHKFPAFINLHKSPDGVVAA